MTPEEKAEYEAVFAKLNSFELSALLIAVLRFQAGELPLDAALADAASAVAERREAKA
jgi:hypothetical protein